MIGFMSKNHFWLQYRQETLKFCFLLIWVSICFRRLYKNWEHSAIQMTNSHPMTVSIGMPNGICQTHDSLVLSNGCQRDFKWQSSNLSQIDVRWQLSTEWQNQISNGCQLSNGSQIAAVKRTSDWCQMADIKGCQKADV